MKKKKTQYKRLNRFASLTRTVLNSLDVRTCQNWFARFRSGNFDRKDKDRSGRPAEADDEDLQGILEEDPRKSTRELAIDLAVSYTTVWNRLKVLESLKKKQKTFLTT